MNAAPDVTVVLVRPADVRVARRVVEALPSDGLRVQLAAVGPAPRVERLLRRAVPGVLLLPDPGGTAWAAADRGLDAAGGRHVLVLAPGDEPLPGAVADAVRLADRAETDLVLGAAPAGAPGGIERADPAALGDPSVFAAPWPGALVRRSLLQREGLRFGAGTGAAPETRFAVAALLAADGVSVPAAPTLQRPPRDEARPSVKEQLAEARTLLGLAEAAGGTAGRRLVERVLSTELARASSRALTAKPEAAWRPAALDGARELLARYHGPETEAALSAAVCVRYRLLELGLDDEAAAVVRHAKRKEPVPRVVDGGRIYAAFDGFRGGGAPDFAFDVSHQLRITRTLTAFSRADAVLRFTGWAFYEQISTSQRASAVVLRERGGAEHRFPVDGPKDPLLLNAAGRPRTLGRFTRTIDLATAAAGEPLPPGRWDVLLAVEFEGVRREVPLGPDRDPAVDLAAHESDVVVPADADGLELAVQHLLTADGALMLEVVRREPLGVAQRERVRS